MRVLFWNIRGFGRKGRRTLLKDYLRLHRIDVVLLQETIKQDFSDAELRSLEIGDKFFWDWLPASGHSGGMLIGVRDSMFEVGAISRGQFFLSVAVLHRVSNRTMDIIGVYGPADHGRSREFLQELSAKIATSTRPLLLGGDFNLIRAAEDKNNSNLNWTLIDLFNDNIASWGLREIPRTGARFTWTNRQLNPVRSALDRVFVSPNFEAIFPLCSLAAETSLGSDHTPLVFDTGEGFPVRNNRFFFESAWLERPEFRSIVHTEWANLSNKVGGRDILDWWNFMSAGLRQHLRGWSHNLGRDSKESKAALLAQITQLDAQADAAGLDEEGWAARYHLEEQLLHLYRVEEEYWKQRGRTNWTLHGDANTAYFHAVANGRRRKCHISMLNTEQGPITDQRLIQQHIYAFYRELLGTTAARSCGLAPDTWAGGQRVSQAEKDRLALTFSEEELENIVKDMKTNTAPGPDGLPVIFFKTFWPLVRRGILHILNDFVLGRIDIARLNFGILSLIPKVPGADQITQFRPIALINVIFKIVSKAYAARLDPVANRIISANQTAFIKGRNILDGPLALIEIIHELKSKNLGGILLKLDFEKAYDRVNWDFLAEVLRAKGFEQGYIHRITQLYIPPSCWPRRRARLRVAPSASARAARTGGSSGGALGVAPPGRLSGGHRALGAGWLRSAGQGPGPVFEPLSPSRLLLRRISQRRQPGWLLAADQAAEVSLRTILRSGASESRGGCGLPRSLELLTHLVICVGQMPVRSVVACSGAGVLRRWWLSVLCCGPAARGVWFQGGGLGRWEPCWLTGEPEVLVLVGGHGRAGDVVAASRVLWRRFGRCSA
ncbi:hypothetical protein QYE76_044713 [Lolium multiflorum]|uniref:Reverse transcriptase domain-containing protein n=1 Tax=Lolium multiflorum TaxID=4521 RepID=A0AAD8WX05_LOLMU|nr:hypothetical protein QYE76_044713 [Lolium multiflorum]